MINLLYIRLWNKDLGITQIPVIIREDLEDEDEQLKKLLATNFGRMKNDPNKQRKVAVQYVELCGNSRGGDRKSNSDNRSLKLSQLEIAQQLGVSETELNRMLEIERTLTPDIKELLDTGIISKTSASAKFCISENENRKDFSFSEKMEWAEKLKEEYSEIARENQKGGQGGILLSPTLDEAKRTDESVAKDLDMGKTTFRKAEYIYQNADNEIIQKLNEEKISINKAWVETKEKLSRIN